MTVRDSDKILDLQLQVKQLQKDLADALKVDKLCRCLECKRMTYEHDEECMHCGAELYE